MHAEPTKALTPFAGAGEARIVRSLRAVAAGAGLLLIAAGLVADRFGWGTYGFGRTQLLLVAAGLAALLFATFGKRTGSAYVYGVVLAANTLLALAIVEVASGGIRVLIRGPATPVDPVAHRRRSESVSYYADKTWAAGYWLEQSRIDDMKTYEPFSLWRTAAFHGRYITIGKDGFRSTPGADCQTDAYKVFVFGASAAWGVGSPDWGTIPAGLQERLGGMDRPLCVRNMAQSALVSTQEVIELIRALQRGEVPDLAIFYDGFNDAYAASIYGRADAHLNVDVIKRRIEGDRGRRDPPWLAAVKTTQTWLLAAQLHRAISGPRAAARARAGRPPTDSLADAVMAAWLTNYRTARALAHEYRFQVAFFWQPALSASGKSLTAEEQRIAEAANGVSGITRAVYQRARSLAPTLLDYHYLGDVLDDEPELTWIDFVHVTPEANQRIAECIARILLSTPN